MMHRNQRTPNSESPARVTAQNAENPEADKERIYSRIARDYQDSHGIMQMNNPYQGNEKSAPWFFFI